MSDPDDLDRRLDDAFERRAGSMSVHPPRIDELVERGQQRTRRVLAGATLTVLAVGAVGFVSLAGTGSGTPVQDALPEPMDDVLAATTTDVGAMTAWRCSGPLGVSPDGSAQYFEACVPDVVVPTTTDAEPAVGAAECAPGPDVVVTTTTCSQTPDTGQSGESVTTTTNPEPCIASRPTVAAPTSTYVPYPTTTTSTVYSTTTLVPARIGASYYSVEVGDYPIRIAEKFCTTIAELVDLNGWTTVEDFLVFPGAAIIVSSHEGVVPDSGTDCPDPLS